VEAPLRIWTVVPSAYPCRPTGPSARCWRLPGGTRCARPMCISWSRQRGTRRWSRMSSRKATPISTAMRSSAWRRNRCAPSAATRRQQHETGAW